MENTQYSDTELIAKILDGDTGLYEILIRRYNPFLYKTGRSYNFGHEDTQDLMQESFIAAYFDLRKFENRASFKTWIIRIMLHKCWHKKQKPVYQNLDKRAIAENEKPLYTTPDDTFKSVMNKELDHVIEKALGEIPEPYRMVFTLREMNAMSVSETAEALTISEDNVKVRLHRAKAMLRSAIEKSYSKDDIFEFNLVYCNAVVNHVMAKIGALSARA